MIYQSVIDSFVSTYSPLKAPQLWTRINAVLVIWSVLLLIEILFTIGPLERLEGTRAYLTYNFGATLVWVAQVGLIILDIQKGSAINTIVSRTINRPCSILRSCQALTKKDIELLMELTVAIYFLFDSTQVFVVWYKADPDVEAQILDTLFNFACYMYEFIKYRNLSVVSDPAVSDAVVSDDYVDIGDEADLTGNTERPK